MTQPRIGFVGAGQMAIALAKGFVASGVVPAENISGFSPTSTSRERFQQATGAVAVSSNNEVIEGSDIVFLAVKPQVAERVLEALELAPSNEKLFVSVIAGLRCKPMAIALKTDRIVRTIPTTPCLIAKGTAAIAAHSGASEEDAAQVDRLLGTIAQTYRVKENAIDAVTGMANPAYVIQFIQALADAGVLVGLSRAMALDLAAQTVLGAAAMVVETGEHPAVLKDRITSPAGTTIAGLKALEDGKFNSTVISAVESSTRRSIELGS